MEKMKTMKASNETLFSLTVPVRVLSMASARPGQGPLELPWHWPSNVLFKVPKHWKPPHPREKVIWTALLQ
jgi:hypothetical protein